MPAEVTKFKSFYYHKIGGGNSLAQRFLSGDNPIGIPAAVIFFGHITPDDILNHRLPDKMTELSWTQTRDFLESSNPERWDETCIVVVGARFWLLKPAGGIEVTEPQDWEDYSPESSRKLMPVEIIVEATLGDIPRVLASIGSNQYLVQGTYRPLTEKNNRGNLKAIYAMLGKPWERSWYESGEASGLFECLDSVELETLVARILEAHGCFVPAYRGGLLKHVDLFARSDSPIDIDGLAVDSSGIQIQVKGRARLAKGELLPETYLVGYDNKVPNEDKERYFDQNWLLAQCRKLPQVSEWLLKSLEWWVPEDFIARFGLR